ncbi:exopolysaccharide biosynthesis polyprenyl glycosylphosphotransferase [Flavobacterium sp. HSC-61S13]|uniref:exopolysaccharide biosynthesis polyprenyl glycosylphosphotransferase n=1 Tax=Flavobacterium sp. HSC-61S13 TaxID=2910963 RepID=UPI00209CCF42|nr:exopolysaccharide biosynthesis polyprenyl glycosylphosphotransferase [Flavobacterium sp. HSC-61S13]MCP1995205.1 putative colanic acid biosynthesis UDP-glucose lipid carrier transferase [Flavobacterium sp. HSC-61S13]
MNKKIGRYSHWIKYIVIAMDFLTIFIFSFGFLKFYLDAYLYLLLLVCWFVIARQTAFYKIYRFTSVISIIQVFFKQYFIYLVCFFALFGVFEIPFQKWTVFTYFIVLGFTLFGIKLLIFHVLKEYRLHYGGNKRHVIVVGNSKASFELVDFFKFNPEYGYYLKEVIVPDAVTNRINLEVVQKYVQQKGIDEIYCSLKSLDSKQISTLFTLANNNFKTIKFIPDNHELLLRKMDLQFYGILPLMTVNQSPLDNLSNAMSKRLFDVFFSLSMILFVFSWLFPIIAICIRMDSKGPIFFKQKRNGLNYREFYCYKFRSLYVKDTEEEYKPVTKKDRRVTLVGGFLRSTSLDELPQFFNVLIGNMSVVGPRPHALIYNQEYTKKVKNFMMRHLIKPGITGMAQTHGYRGEVENKRDIVNRVKYDIFYIQNWTLLLDVKIIFITLINTFSGDKKAY